jgi:hypothetical protein
LGTLTLAACSDEIAQQEDNNGTDAGEVMVHFNVQVRGNTEIATRTDAEAVEADENKINNLVAIVFDSDNKLAYMATIVSHDKEKHTLTLKMKVSADTGDKQRVVLLANYYKTSGALYGGTDANNDKGKDYDTWRSSLELKAGATVVDVPDHGVPMWGESAAFIVKAGASGQSIALMRALARIDIALKLTKGTDGKYGTDAAGLPGYTLNDVTIYYGSTYGALIPLAANLTNGKITAPTVPAETDVDADHTYTVTGDKLVRHIYVGEQPKGGFSGDGTNAFTMVAGITHQGIESYYRINLTAQNNESALLDILRNHRYIINIQNITGKGWADKETALASKPANIEWVCDVEDYNQSTQISGNYYFQIDKWITVGGNSTNHKKVKFKTNLPHITQANFAWNEKLSAANVTTIFKSLDVVDLSTSATGITTGALYVEANETNTTGALRGTYFIDVKEVKPIDDFTIEVSQDVGRNIYEIVAATPAGLYLPVAYYANGTTVNGSRVRKRYPLLNGVHYLDVTLRTLASDNLNSGSTSWVVKSAKKVNGYEFSDTGFFKDATKDPDKTIAYNYTDDDGKPQTASIKVRDFHVKVRAVYSPDPSNPQAGTFPLLGGYDFFDLTTEGTDLMNSGAVTGFSSVRIKVGYDLKQLTTYSWYRGYFGYSTECGGSKTMLNSTYNFSLTGTVPVEGFVKKQPARSEYLGAVMGTNHALVKAINTTAINAGTAPDIVLLALNFRFDSSSAPVVWNYIKNGGVVIMLSDGYYKSSLKDNVEQVVYRVVKDGATPPATPSISSLTGSGKNWLYDGGGGTIYPFPAKGETYDNSPDITDPILNGPFLDLRGRQWGDDVSATGFVTGLTASDPVVIYTRDSDERNKDASAGHSNYGGTGKRGTTLFRSTKYGFLYVADGGFISQHSYTLGNTGREPFYIDRQGRPVIVTRFGGTLPRRPVYNSYVFGNIMAWAIDYAQFYGVNSKTKATGDYAPWF